MSQKYIFNTVPVADADTQSFGKLEELLEYSPTLGHKNCSYSWQMSDCSGMFSRVFRKSSEAKSNVGHPPGPSGLTYY